MKHTFRIGAIIFILTIIITAGVISLFPVKPFGHEILNTTIDTSKKFEFHLEGYNVRFIKSDDDIIKVSQSQYHKMLYEDNVKVTYEENILKINSENKPQTSFRNGKFISSYQPLLWHSLMQFNKYYEYNQEKEYFGHVDFYIYIPKDIKATVYSMGSTGFSGNIKFERSNKAKE